MMEQLPISTDTTTWQTINEFTIPAQLDCEREANRLILEAINALQSQASWQHRLSKAIVKATCKAKERAGAGGEIHIRVMASGRALKGEKKDSLQKEAIAAAGEDGELTKKTSQGWNFFLIERNDSDQPENGSATRGKKQHVVEIFLYIEG